MPEPEEHNNTLLGCEVIPASFTFNIAAVVDAGEHPEAPDTVQ